MSRKQKCFLCGSNEEITREHFVPKNIFPKPRPTNLLTAPCCRPCNESYCQEDEDFRVYASSHISKSQVGQKVWDDKVMGSSFKRSCKFKKQISDSMSRVFINSSSGNAEMPTILVSKDLYDRILTKITKGMIYKFYPQIDYNKLSFEIDLMANSFDHDEFIHANNMINDQRGDGIFRFARTVEENNDNTGIWIFVFYGGLTFQVFHSEEPKCATS